MRMNRRSFLSLGQSESETVEICCEQLHRRFLEARSEGREPAFLEGTAREFSAAQRVRLRQPAWLDRDALGVVLAPLLREYQAGGGSIDFG